VRATSRRRCRALAVTSVLAAATSTIGVSTLGKAAASTAGRASTATLYKTPAGQFRAPFPVKPTVRQMTAFDVLLSTLGRRADKPAYIVSTSRWSASVKVVRLSDRSAADVVDVLEHKLHFDFVKHGNAWIAPSGVTTASVTTLDSVVVVTKTNVYSALVSAATRKASRSFIASFAAPGMLDW